MLNAKSAAVLRSLSPLKRLYVGRLTRRRSPGALASLLVASLITAGLAGLLLWSSGPAQGAADSASVATQDRLAVTQAPPTALVLGADGAPAEGGPRITVVAVLDSPAGAGGATVALTTGGAAAYGDDYTLSLTTVDIAPGATAGLAYITIMDDQIDEDAETIILYATIADLSLTASPLTLTIKDSDDPTIMAMLCTNLPADGDYDADDDGLIEVSCLPQLDAIRWDVDGDGVAIAAEALRYAAAFPGAVANMGCPSSGCQGYELTAGLDFDTNANGEADAGDAYWNKGLGWVPIGWPIGFGAQGTEVVFEGNDHTISNLYIDIDEYFYPAAGLFGTTQADSIIRNVGLESVNVSGSRGAHVGGLVGRNFGTISDSYTTGTVSGRNSVGGLVGTSLKASLIVDSHSTAGVTGETDDVGGLVGTIEGGSVTASHATGDVSASGRGIGGLVGLGTEGSHIAASYATGQVSGSHAVGGLIGYMDVSQPGTVVASYATGNPSGDHDVGGLIGNTAATVIASYATGRSTGNRNIGGLIGHYANAVVNVTNGYWDFETSGIDRHNAGTGRATAQLRRPTDYTGIYADWNVDVDGDETADDPWDFGTSTQYPVLKYGGLNVDAQRAGHPAFSAAAPTDYDADDDGLIDVSTLKQLNAIRWDLDGDGASGNTGHSAAFADPVEGLGCPTSGCVGYELVANLDMDTNSDGQVDAGDTFASWSPIGTRDGYFGVGFDTSFDGIFEGNDHTISNLRIRREARGVGLFNSAGEDSVIRNVGLVDVDVSSSRGFVGGLVGAGYGEIRDSYVTGTVSGRREVGGLVGFAGTTGVIVDSYATADVTNRTNGSGGGLVGANRGVISGSYATGGVTGQGYALGGLVGRHDRGHIKASFATGDINVAGQYAGGLVGYTTSSVTATYATGNVSGNISYGAGGLLGNNPGLVSSSYSTGTVSGSAWSGGLIGGTPTVSPSINSYWDTTTSGMTVSAEGEGKTTSELQSPAGYTGIYADWNVDLDGDNSADDPWDFGNSCQYPVLKHGNLDPDAQRASCTPLLLHLLNQATPNREPTVSATIADATIGNESGTKQVSLSGVFSDANYDALTITAVSSNEAVATVSVASGYSSLTVNAHARGKVTVTVTADDSNGGTVSDTFTVTVKAAPALASALADISGLEVDATQDVSLLGVFSDADGDALTISATSSDDAVATVTVASDGSKLTVEGVSEGTATITVTAQDADDNRVSDTFEAPVAKKYAGLIAQMREWRNDQCCAHNKEHTDRWDRALLAFGEKVADTTLTKMTAAEAQDHADNGWTRWVEVAKALKELEGGG